MGSEIVVITPLVFAALSAAEGAGHREITWHYPAKIFRQMGPFVQIPTIITPLIAITEISHNNIINENRGGRAPIKLPGCFTVVIPKNGNILYNKDVNETLPI